MDDNDKLIREIHETVIRTDERVQNLVPRVEKLEETAAVTTTDVALLKDTSARVRWLRRALVTALLALGVSFAGSC